MIQLDFSNPPLLMGIVNVTPDSFSDGGRYLDPEYAIAHGRQLAADGAAILDIGGESTRPGAVPVSAEEELRRILPVVEGLRACGALVSVDTRHAQTMTDVLKAGAGMINDVTALREDGSMDALAHSDAYVCLMHMQGTPQDMQTDPRYANVVEDVFNYLEARLEACCAAGIDRSRLIIDPGIGFGKTLTHNLALLSHLDRFQDLGVPVLLGVSRKSFIGALSQDVPADRRLPGSLAAALEATRKGVQILRVHDVAETRQALDVYHAMTRAA